MALASLLASPAAAQPQATLSVTAMDPAGGELAPGAPLSLRVHYRSAQALRVQARGRKGGEDVPGMMNAAPLLAAGEGDALAWIAFREARSIDSVRLVVADGNWKHLGTLDVPVRAAWRQGARPRHAARWVRQLRAHQELAARRAATPPDSVLFNLLFALIPLLVLGYLLLQVLLPMRWSGGWKRAALIPLLVMVPALGVSLLALLAQANLWPLWLIFLSPLMFAYLALLLVLRLATRYLGSR
ncbi:MAG TPA: hypothetical protein VFG73_05730 [Rhodanobacteraceae bacterium]|nr:hypothetical protein [Rhodanobacteraceae bacterium]